MSVNVLSKDVEKWRRNDFAARDHLSLTGPDAGDCGWRSAEWTTMRWSGWCGSCRGTCATRWISSPWRERRPRRRHPDRNGIPVNWCRGGSGRHDGVTRVLYWIACVPASKKLSCIWWNSARSLISGYVTAQFVVLFENNDFKKYVMKFYFRPLNFLLFWMK